ncbi:hypothetical protein J6590_102865 [Homalodisca vitripennis]|nr:hypothetical protein J6590_102865 [Homalodisca vitripennis]
MVVSGIEHRFFIRRPRRMTKSPPSEIATILEDLRQEPEIFSDVVFTHVMKKLSNQQQRAGRNESKGFDSAVDCG